MESLLALRGLTTRQSFPAPLEGWIAGQPAGGSLNQVAAIDLARSEPDRQAPSSTLLNRHHPAPQFWGSLKGRWRGAFKNEPIAWLQDCRGAHKPPTLGINASELANFWTPFFAPQPMHQGSVVNPP